MFPLAVWHHIMRKNAPHGNQYVLLEIVGNLRMVVRPSYVEAPAEGRSMAGKISLLADFYRCIT